MGQKLGSGTNNEKKLEKDHSKNLRELPPVIRFKQKVSFWGTMFIGVGLIGLGILTFVAPEMSSKNYGIPTSESGNGWVMACGVRDLVFGFFLILISADRLRLPIVLGLLLMIPIGDVLFSTFYGNSVSSTFIHFGGTLVIAFVMVCSLYSET